VRWEWASDELQVLGGEGNEPRQTVPSGESFGIRIARGCDASGEGWAASGGTGNHGFPGWHGLGRRETEVDGRRRHGVVAGTATGPGFRLIGCDMSGAEISNFRLTRRVRFHVAQVFILFWQNNRAGTAEVQRLGGLYGLY